MSNNIWHKIGSWILLFRLIHTQLEEACKIGSNAYNTEPNKIIHNQRTFLSKSYIKTSQNLAKAVPCLQLKFVISLKGNLDLLNIFSKNLLAFQNQNYISFCHNCDISKTELLQCCTTKPELFILVLRCNSSDFGMSQLWEKKMCSFDSGKPKT